MLISSLHLNILTISGGDPTGTGHGGDSIYGETFKVHTRV